MEAAPVIEPALRWGDFRPSRIKLSDGSSVGLFEKKVWRFKVWKHEDLARSFGAVSESQTSHTCATAAHGRTDGRTELVEVGGKTEN